MEKQLIELLQFTNMSMGIETAGELARYVPKTAHCIWYNEADRRFHSQVRSVGFPNLLW